MDKIQLGQLLMMGGIIAALVIGAAFLVMFLMFFNLWLRAFVTRAGIGILRLVTMKLRKVNPQVIVDTKVMAVQAGLSDVTNAGLEAHFLAGGNVRRVVQALIAAHRAKIQLNWDTAAAIDLAGRNVLEAVQTSVNPKVIDCPDAKRTGRQTLDGVAKNGIQLKVRARVTVRTRSEPGWSVLEVEDNGPGIAPADRERVLQRFQRGPQALGTGSGLGLAIVADIVAQHGGTLCLEDTEPRRQPPGPDAHTAAAATAGLTGDTAADLPGLRVRVRLPAAAPLPDA